MNPRRFALITGILLLVIGAGGFVPPLVFAVTDPIRIAARVDHPQLLGILAVSIVLNLVRIGLGLWGLYASRQMRGSVLYARRLAIIIGLLALLGMTPLTDTLFGLAPLYGNSLLFHGFLALWALLVGILHKAPRSEVEADPEDDEIDDDPYEEGASASLDRR